MDNENFWVWTLFFVLLSIFVTKFICLCSSYNYNERNDYIHLLKKPIPLHTYKTSHIVNKIDSEKV